MKKKLPIVIALVTALVLSYIYFNPVLSGKRLNEYDKLNALGAQEEAVNFYKEEGKPTNWSNSMFGGMPTVSFAPIYKGNVITFIRKYEKLGIYPASFFVIMILGAFLCLILFGVNPWLSIVGALLYSFATYNFILVDTGHITKARALSYLAPLIASIYYTFKKNKLTGAFLTAIFLALEISAIHPQILYYALLVVLILGIVFLISSIIQKTLQDYFKSVAYLILPLFLAVGVNANYLITTQEYSEFSTRGKAVLTSENEQQTTGLDKDYILDYSYDVSEAFSAFIPRLKGGSMNEKVGTNSKLYDYLEKSQGKQQASKIVQSIPLYWGSQPIVAGPFYFGAITIFLFVLGIFTLKGREKWWLLAVVIVSFMLSLGKYLPSVSNLAIDYLPLYNKFRDVKNIVFVQCFAMWVMGLLALKQLFQDTNLTEKDKIKGIKYATIVTGGIALAFAIFPTLAGNYSGSVDQQLAGQGWPKQLIDFIVLDRKSIARSDSFRSLAFVLLTAILLWMVIKNKLKKQYALIIATVLILADLWPVNKRYLNNDDFVTKSRTVQPFKASKADEIILQDKTLDYRVLNMAVNPWSDASTSYFHKSIGGYSAAKLRRYQDMIENHLSPEMQTLATRLQNVKSQEDVDGVFKGLNALNMLNTKYVIYNPLANPLLNQSALGNAWFVNQYTIVANANNEIGQIDKVDVQTTAIVNQEFKDLLPSELSVDSTATIILTSYAPNKLVYKASATTNQLAVFSEIYYPKGWEATIDGKEQPIFRANYVLRGLTIPAGEHEIVFEFKPESYSIGNKISLASSILLLLALAGVVFVEIRKKKNVINAE